MNTLKKYQYLLIAALLLDRALSEPLVAAGVVVGILLMALLGSEAKARGAQRERDAMKRLLVEWGRPPVRRPHRISAAQVREIRKLAAEGLTGPAIAERVGVSTATVYRHRAA